MLLPVDLAHLKRVDLERMITRWSGARRRVIARRLATGTQGGQPKDHLKGGTPLILPRWLYSRALGIGGDRGLKELVGELSSGDVALLSLPSAGLDIDTPRELERARRRMRRFGQEPV